VGIGLASLSTSYNAETETETVIGGYTAGYVVTWVLGEGHATGQVCVAHTLPVVCACLTETKAVCFGDSMGAVYMAKEGSQDGDMYTRVISDSTDTRVVGVVPVEGGVVAAAGETVVRLDAELKVVSSFTLPCQVTALQAVRDKVVVGTGDGDVVVLSI
ncbi:hypothetical protein KIPB_012535, partial [Kipferlia bialata]